MDWDKARVFGLWILVSVLAIAIIGDLPYLAIAVAIVGGVAVGIAHLVAFEQEERKREKP